MSQYYIDKEYEVLYLHVKDSNITKTLNKRGYKWNFDNQTYSIATGAYEDYLIVHRPSGRVFLQRNPSQTKEIIDFLKLIDWNLINLGESISFQGCKPSVENKPIKKSNSSFCFDIDIENGYNWNMSYKQNEAKFILNEIEFLTKQ